MHHAVDTTMVLVETTEWCQISLATVSQQVAEHLTRYGSDTFKARWDLVIYFSAES